MNTDALQKLLNEEFPDETENIKKLIAKQIETAPIAAICEDAEQVTTLRNSYEF